MVVGRLCTGRHVGAWRFCLEVSLGKNSGDRGVVRKAVGDDQLRFRPDQTRPDQDRTGQDTYLVVGQPPITLSSLYRHV